MGMLNDIATQVDRELVIAALEEELRGLKSDLRTYLYLVGPYVRYLGGPYVRGMCAGLERAIEITREVLKEGR